jgi:hypothetical protein
MDLVISVIVAIVVGVLIVEIYAWLPKISKWALERAVRRLPAEERERCREQWTADLDGLPDTTVKLIYGFGCFIAAHRITADTVEEKRHKIRSNMQLIRRNQVVIKQALVLLKPVMYKSDSVVKTKFDEINAKFDDANSKIELFLNQLDTTKARNDDWETLNFTGKELGDIADMLRELL